MAIRNALLGGTDYSDGEALGDGDLDDTNNAIIGGGLLGEVKMFALSMSGAITKASLIARGWAICDGTTPATQGISSPTITTTPDLQNKFISMSDDETSGTTGGSATMAHTHSHTHTGDGDAVRFLASGGDYKLTNDATAASNTENRPPFYEMAFFLKVKVL